MVRRFFFVSVFNVENVLTIVMFAVNKTVRKKFYLVINMAFADLLLGTLSLSG